MFSSLTLTKDHQIVELNSPGVPGSLGLCLCGNEMSSAVLGQRLQLGKKQN